MKIRNGYVSNSSSSSFIISDENFPTVKDLAKYMINQMDNDYSQEILDKLNKLNIDDNAPLSFPSCNYDTYIKKVGDRYLVSTCNNENWELWDYHTQLSELSKIELIKLQCQFIKGSDDYDAISEILDGDYEDISTFDFDYYDLQHDIVGVEVYETCPKCKNYTMWKTQKYGQICLKCNPILKRAEKLEIINKISNE